MDGLGRLTCLNQNSIARRSNVWPHSGDTGSSITCSSTHITLLDSAHIMCRWYLLQNRAEETLRHILSSRTTCDTTLWLKSGVDAYHIGEQTRFSGRVNLRQGSRVL